MLDAGGRPVPFGEIIDPVYGSKPVKGKTIQSDISRLNNHLLDIGFPSTLYTEAAHVMFASPL